MPRSKIELAEAGRRYGDFLIGVFRRLACDDGATVTDEDLKLFEAWHSMKVQALETQLRAEGATEHDIGVWRGAWRDQIAPRTNQTKATTF
jgi:hypothetical protein